MIAADDVRSACGPRPNADDAGAADPDLMRACDQGNDLALTHGRYDLDQDLVDLLWRWYLLVIRPEQQSRLGVMLQEPAQVRQRGKVSRRGSRPPAARPAGADARAPTCVS